jgi:4-amino-4-deoxy-L-arabinose transferase-like glycosyltransferase
MPGLFWLTLVGMSAALWRWRAERAEVLVLAFALFPMAGLLLAAVATSQRYVADFCPFLICGASYGVVAANSLPRSWQRLARVLVSALTAAAILISLAITLRFQAELVWDVPEDVAQSYRSLGRHLDHLFGTALPGK